MELRIQSILISKNFKEQFCNKNMSGLIRMCGCRAIEAADGERIPRGAPGNDREYGRFELTHATLSRKCEIDNLKNILEAVPEKDKGVYRELIEYAEFDPKYDGRERCPTLEEYMENLEEGK